METGIDGRVHKSFRDDEWKIGAWRKRLVECVRSTDVTKLIVYLLLRKNTFKPHCSPAVINPLSIILAFIMNRFGYRLYLDGDKPSIKEMFMEIVNEYLINQRTIAIQPHLHPQYQTKIIDMAGIERPAEILA